MNTIDQSFLPRLINDPEFDGLRVAGRVIPRDELLAKAEYDAQAAKHKRELVRLEGRLSTQTSQSERLRLENLIRTVKAKHLDAIAKSMSECFRLGIPVHIGLRNKTAADRVNERLEHLFGGQ